MLGADSLLNLKNSTFFQDYLMYVLGIVQVTDEENIPASCHLDNF